MGERDVKRPGQAWSLCRRKKIISETLVAASGADLWLQMYGTSYRKKEIVNFAEDTRYNRATWNPLDSPNLELHVVATPLGRMRHNRTSARDL